MNDFSPSGVKQRRAIIISAVAAAVILGFLLYKGLDKKVNNEIDQSVIVTGSFACLPLKSGEATAENCVLGLQSKEGKYYALDISRIQDANTDLGPEDTIAVTGWLKPKSEIDDSGWEDYEIERIILVNTLLRTR